MGYAAYLKPRKEAISEEGIEGIIDLANLQDAAKSMTIMLKDLDRKINEVQIVCKGKLVPGDSLRLEYRGESLPLYLIFGTPLKRDIRGFQVFISGFNLSS